MNYLTCLGHRRIGYIAGRMELVSSNQRLQGYKDGLAAAGIPLLDELIEFGDYTVDTAVNCARKLLSLARPPDGNFRGQRYVGRGRLPGRKRSRPSNTGRLIGGRV